MRFESWCWCERRVAIVGYVTGEAKELPLRPVFDRRIKLEFHGARITSDGGLLAYRERVVKFDNGRGTAEQWIKEGKNALRWTRLSCHVFRHNAARLQLHALAHNLA